MKKISENCANNLKSGFEKCGIYPLNRDKVLNMLPVEYDDPDVSDHVNSSLKEFLKTMRSPETTNVRQKRKKLNVQPGQSVEVVRSSNSEYGDQSDSSSTVDQPEDVVDSIISPAVISDDSSDEEDDSSDEEDDGDVNIETLPHIIKYNQRFDNVHPISQMADVKDGMWLLVSFEVISKKTTTSKKIYKYYICKVLKCDHGELIGTSLRNINTRDHFGFIYGFPNVTDEFTFSFFQIIGKLDDPKPYKRGLFKFKINYKSL
ncbi:uncharacterized protein LOC132936561 [Metopolophium dirhodum]|uniref:uncharacterized protein LOC132936561 n=1 Tax=Metopolophium dirhodum TaxID=44670 RepID=UPI0029903095|nr:uncharacterized protein LOC132936561 [Metopolophium dirhodum]